MVRQLMWTNTKLNALYKGNNFFPVLSPGFQMSVLPDDNFYLTTGRYTIFSPQNLSYAVCD